MSTTDTEDPTAGFGYNFGHNFGLAASDVDDSNSNSTDEDEPTIVTTALSGSAAGIGTFAASVTTAETEPAPEPLTTTLRGVATGIGRYTASVTTAEPEPDDDDGGPGKSHTRGNRDEKSAHADASEDASGTGS